MMLVPASSAQPATTRIRPPNYRRVSGREYYGRGAGLGAMLAHRPATKVVFLKPRVFARGFAGVLEDAESSAAASGLCMSCKSQDVCFPFVDPNTGKSCYTENICAPCGTEDYSYMADLIAKPGGGQVLAVDLAHASAAGASAPSYTSSEPEVLKLQQQAIAVAAATPPPPPPSSPGPAAPAPAGAASGASAPSGGGAGTRGPSPAPPFSWASLLTGSLVDGLPNWALAAGLIAVGMFVTGRG